MNTKPLKIVIHNDFASELAAVLETPHVLQSYDRESDSEITAILSDADVFVSGEFRPAWRDEQKTGRPRLVQTVGAGVDGIDFASLPPDCTICNVYGHERAVAEQAFMLMLALTRNLFKLDAALRRGDWTPQQP
jgi:phosphoglycerate dehydrogenase-like enzyme